MKARRPPPRALATGRAALLLVLGACTFDPSGTGGAPGTPGRDGSPVGGDDGGPAGCPAALHTELAVGGQPASGSAPLVTVLLGDTVELSAAGSCSQLGPVRYQWEIEDQGLSDTASPALDRETLDVYPSLPGDYRITLTVSDDSGSDEPVSVIGIRALGWQTIAGELDVRDVAIGGGRVWIASSGEAHVLDLANPGAGTQLVNDIAGGEDIADDLNAVHFGAGSNLVWFGRRAAPAPQIWRVAISSPTPSTASVALPTPPTTTEIRDISSSGNGIAVATRDGVFVAANNQTFGPAVLAVDTFAVAENSEGGWAGGNELHDLAGGAPFLPFGDGNNKIRALAGDAVRVWAGSDDQGIARFTSGAETAPPFTVADGLPSNKIRALAVDSESDVWAATDKGVARYKRDRAIWVSMEAEAGLEGITDVHGIAVLDSGGQRVIVIGANGGVGALGL
jgi:PKD domain